VTGLSFMARDEVEAERRELVAPMVGRALLMVALAAVTACGDAPLESIGSRSSDWINEPTVPSTLAVVTTPPTIVPADRLLWANDQIQTENLGDHSALLQEVFGRREGDRFIQASRREITVALPDVAFPGVVPSGAEWVSSQLVFNNDGTIASDPSAAFGIWSAEPYTRSRSVAQMVVLRVATDPVAAEEVASGEPEPSCDRFAERSAESCEIASADGRPLWLLSDPGGSTVIWFDRDYRYELFGRSFVSLSILEDMAAGAVPLASLAGESS
jgi:hypothetical protein